MVDNAKDSSPAEQFDIVYAPSIRMYVHKHARPNKTLPSCCSFLRAHQDGKKPE